MKRCNVAWASSLVWTAVALSFFVTEAVAWRETAQTICEDEIGVPFLIVKGIVAVESEGDPYTLNVKIGKVWRAYRFEDEVSTQLFLIEALKETEHIDIGLMQIHWAVWKGHYQVQATDLVDLETNLKIGCDILRQELAGEGPLWRRIGRYHSRTPHLNETYALKVLHASLQR